MRDIAGTKLFQEGDKCALVRGKCSRNCPHYARGTEGFMIGDEAVEGCGIQLHRHLDRRHQWLLEGVGQAAEQARNLSHKGLLQLEALPDELARRVEFAGNPNDGILAALLSSPENFQRVLAGAAGEVDAVRLRLAGGGEDEQRDGDLAPSARERRDEHVDVVGESGVAQLELGGSACRRNEDENDQDGCRENQAGPEGDVSDAVHSSVPLWWLDLTDKA